MIAATNDSEVNIAVHEDAEARAMLVNVVDVPPLCNFILPAIVRSGPLAIAISTAGASPALAKRMKREIAEQFGEHYARLAVMLNDARGWAKATLPTFQERKAFFESIVGGDPDPIALLRDGDETAVLALIEDAKPPPPRAALSAARRAGRRPAFARRAGALHAATRTSASRGCDADRADRCRWRRRWQAASDTACRCRRVDPRRRRRSPAAVRSPTPPRSASTSPRPPATSSSRRR